MPDKLKSPDKQQPMELTTDFLGEDRHEFVAKLAYKLWEGRVARSVRLRLTGSQRNELCTRRW